MNPQGPLHFQVTLVTALAFRRASLLQSLSGGVPGPGEDKTAEEKIPGMEAPSFRTKRVRWECVYANKEFIFDVFSALLGIERGLIPCQVHKGPLTTEGLEERPLLSRGAHCRETQGVLRGPAALAMPGSV